MPLLYPNWPHRDPYPNCDSLLSQLWPLSPCQPQLYHHPIPAFARSRPPVCQPLFLRPRLLGVLKLRTPGLVEGPLGSLHILGWEAQWGERIRTFSNPKDKKFQRTRQPVGGEEGQVSAELGHASAPPTPYYPSSAPARDFPVQRRGGKPKRKVRRRLGGAAPLPFAVRALDPER